MEAYKQGLIEKKEDGLHIKVGHMFYRDLNYMIYQKAKEGIRNFYLDDVIGQRYIGAGLNHDIKIVINGIPGQDLGVFNGGSKIIVKGNAQDGVGNTMNDGFIVVYGNVGDIPGHMMRNGKIYIRGSAGFRAGIMMKEYGRKKPIMIIGERIGDYLGEYMAGGTIIVLGYSMAQDESPVGHYVASGIFGGTVWIRGMVSREQIGNGNICKRASENELEEIIPYIKEYSEIFNISFDEILSKFFWKITKSVGRPFGKLYVPSNKIGGDFFPLHINLKSPCENACPIGIPNQLIIRKIKDGNLQDAYDLIDDYTPFRYSCCGLTCPRFCEKSCTRNMINDPVPIGEIARKYVPRGPVKIKEGKKNERIAIIGSGPAGLSAAWHLARLGYYIEVFEKESELGGKLINNVPQDRLPREMLMKEIERIRSLDIKFNVNSKIDLKKIHEIKNNYDAVVIAIGVHKPKKLGFPGEENAISSYDFLYLIKHDYNKMPDLSNKNIVIIGAGNVGMDVASESFKYGANSVTAIDVKTPSAFINEIKRAEILGTRIIFPRFIDRYENGMVYFKNDDPIKADILIEAIGENTEYNLSELGILIDRDNFTTNVPGLYVIGDAVKPGFIADAIGAGKRIAEYIHNNFRGIIKVKNDIPTVDKRHINLVYFQKKDSFTDNLLDKCASCGTCIQCDICVENCPHDAVSRIGEKFEINIETCAGCGVCASLCPRGAIIMVKKTDLFLEESSEGTKIETQTHSISCKK